MKRLKPVISMFGCFRIPALFLCFLCIFTAVLGQEDADTFYFLDGKVEKGTLVREVLDYFVVKDGSGQTQRMGRDKLQKIVLSSGKVIQISSESVSAPAREPVPVPPPAAPKEVKPEIGYLTLKSTPEAASISIDGTAKGVTPVEKLELTPGVHEVEISLNLHVSILKKVEIEKGKTEKISEKLKLAADTLKIGFLEIQSDPKGARIVIDGVEKGITPQKDLALEAGTHAVLVNLDGYKIEEKVVTLKHKDKEKLKFKLTAEAKTASPVLEPVPVSKGSLSVLSRPSAAAITIDGVPNGATPLKGLSLTEGTYTIAVSLPGFEEQTRTVEIKNGKSEELRITLKPAVKAKPPETAKPVSKEKSFISVSSSPMGASISIDGIEQGITPNRQIGVEPGFHKVTLRLIDHMDAEKEVEVTPGKTRKVSFDLKLTPERIAWQKTLNKKPRGKLITRIATATASLALYQGAVYFQMESNKKFDEYKNPANTPSTLQTLHQQIRKDEMRRNLFIGGGSVVLLGFGLTFAF